MDLRINWTESNGDLRINWTKLNGDLLINNVGAKTHGFNREDDSPHYLYICVDIILIKVYKYDNISS